MSQNQIELGESAQRSELQPRKYNVTLTLNNVTVNSTVMKSKRPYLSPWHGIARAVVSKCESVKFIDFNRINNINTSIKPGEMVLIMSAPGDGSSTLLKAIANKVKLAPGSIMTINGIDVNDLKRERGLSYEKVVSYSDQADTHIEFLTVRETLDFSSSLSNPYHNDRDKNETSVDKVIDMLHLREAEHTYIGNEFVKGVSGGQKKRVTTGEQLVSGAAVVIMDNYSDGLDSNTTTQISQALRQSCDTTGRIVIASLKQPPPEVFALYDHIIVLKEGQVIYDGPNGDSLENYFEAMGFKDPNMDLADFIIDVLTQPRSAALKTVAFTCSSHNNPENNPNCQSCMNKNDDQYPHEHQSGVFDPSFEYNKPVLVETAAGTVTVAESPRVVTSQMVEFYRKSPQYTAIRRDILKCLPIATFIDVPKGVEVVNQHNDVRIHELSPITTDPRLFLAKTDNYLTQMSQLAKRYALITFRNKPILFARIINAFAMALLFGSLFWQIEPSNPMLRIGELFLSTLQLSFSQLINIPSGLMYTKVFHKQQKLYSSPMFVFMNVLLAVPFSFFETLVYIGVIYFMTGSFIGPSHIILSTIIILFQSIQLASWFNMSTVTQNETLAQAISIMVTGFMMLLSLISPQSMPSWIRNSIVWASPFFWEIRALMNIEYGSSRYNDIVVNPLTPAGETIRQGDYLLHQANIKVGSFWIGYSVLYLVGYTIFTMILHALLLHSPYHEESKGTQRSDIDDEIIDPELINSVQAGPNSHIISHIMNDTDTTTSSDDNNNTKLHFNHNRIGKNPLSLLQQYVPMEPTWLAFQNIKYTVSVPNPDDPSKKMDRILLHDVNGYAQPGKMLALMGASGAGKTTLLNVLSAKANSGRIEGNITLNDQLLSDKTTKYIGFVEQFDSLYGFDTVYETLLFAARLRLSSSVPDQAKHNIVEEILHALNLTPLREELIGDMQLKNLSFAQRKLVSIGVELVANPPVLFLDEPSTGLDSKSASALMKIIRRIASAGKTIICTIHQPNSSIFLSFDSLVLLAPGGLLQYNGDIGPYGRTLGQYLQTTNSKIAKMKPKTNPSVWMLEELGKFDKNGLAELANVFQKSELFSKIQNRIDDINKMKIINQSNTDEIGQCQSRNMGIYRDFGYGGQSGGNTPNPNNQTLETANDDTPNNLTPEQSITRLPTCRADITTGQQDQQDQRVGVLGQFIHLLQRNSHGYVRSPFYIFARLFMIVGLSVCFGLIFQGLKPDKSMTYSIALIYGIFVPPFFAGLLHAATSVPWNFALRPAFYRETQDSYYHAGLWVPVNLVLEIIWVAVASICIQPMYFIIGLPLDIITWLQYLLVLFAVMMTFTSTGMAIANLVPNNVFAQLFAGIYFCLGFSFSGFALPYPQLPRAYRWLYRLLTLGYSLEAMSDALFGDVTKEIPIFMNGISITMPANDFIGKYIGIEYGGYWMALMWVLVYNVGMLILAWLGATFLRFIKK
jgi:ABC-type multidrug transport system ATPase subunit